MVMKMILICECETCGDFEEVQRIRKKCPLGGNDYADGRECDIYHRYRIKCDSCDYSDDLYSGFINDSVCDNCSGVIQ